MSASRFGSLCMAFATAVIGTPNRSRGITLIGLRTARQGFASCSWRSIAISPPEFPNPTTRTGRSRYGDPFLYSELWYILPLYDSWPGQRGIFGRAVYPLATHRPRDLYSRAWVVVYQ